MTIFERSVPVICALALLAFKFVAANPQWHTAKDGQKFLIESDLQFNWLQAFDECARKDLQLVVIKNSKKNAALVELLLSISDQLNFFWIGLHDEFNTLDDTKRFFYAASNGQKVSFGNWHTNEPTNANHNEHCAEIAASSNYKWISNVCDTKLLGYICEEYHITTTYKIYLEQGRQIANENNMKISHEFDENRLDIQDINKNLQKDINNELNIFSQSIDDIIEEVEKYVTVLQLENQQALDKIAAETLEFIENLQLSAENSTSFILSEHSENLVTNRNDVDQILQI